LKKRHEITGEIPHDLRQADEILIRYGRAVMDRHRKHHCASAEGRYPIPPNDDDREPREILMPAPDAALVQRALIGVPERERLVLQILYVPQRLPPEAQLRIKRIPAQLSAQRHIDGLRMFHNRHRAELLQSTPRTSRAAESPF
jgi:hypothetical protein